MARTTEHSTDKAPATLLEALDQALCAAGRSAIGEMAPAAAVLWTDEDAEWARLLPSLLDRLPHLLVLGKYEPARRTGPAIWIKCALEGTLPDLRLPQGVLPIVYLPRVSRQVLRAGSECPKLLQPIVELLYRGATWNQRNGKDWTLEAFLTSSEGGLGLDVAMDERTRAALRGSIEVFAETPLIYLAGRRLEADDFDKLLVEDPERDLLHWLDRPGVTRESWDKDRWLAFRSRCRERYDFDPESEGDVAGGEKLGLKQEPAWKSVWKRFCEAPDLYPGIPVLLSRSMRSIPFERESWPQLNQEEEDELRKALLETVEIGAGAGRDRVLELERGHGHRRPWVWAKLGLSPLARALEHLATLAKETAKPFAGDSSEAMAIRYSEGAYRADDAVLRALASVISNDDGRAVRAAVRSLYRPWVQDSAERFQALVAQEPLPARGKQRAVEVEKGECLLFVDGLRFDLTQRLRGQLEARGLRVAGERRWAALPTVTATAKPAVSPLETSLSGAELPDDFQPRITASGESLTPARFRKLLEEAGYSILAEDEIGAPGALQAKAWTECGAFDQRGHDLGAGLAAMIPSELERVLERVEKLLEAGWRAVRIVTDHGWVLLPDGLPKHDLPAYLVGSRWARCATIKGRSRVEVPKIPWHWNPAIELATAPGVACFTAGCEYAHGGVSIQECLLEELRVTPATDASPERVVVKEVQWFGLRCRVAVEPADTRLRVDLRSRPLDAGSSLVGAPKPPDLSGRVSLVVENEDLSGTAAVLVVLDNQERVVARHPTTVGGDH